MTTKHRPSFIGRDPAYTGPHPASRPVAQPADDMAPPPAAPPADAEADPSRPSAAPTPRPQRSTQPRPEASHASAPASDGACRINAKVHLGESATAHLETIARDTGESPEQLLRYLRQDVASALRALLATDTRPAYPAPPRVGASVRVQLSLRDEDYRRARQWLDPLGIGDHVLRDRLRPVLAALFQERVKRLVG